LPLPEALAGLLWCVGKKKKTSSDRTGQRTRTNPLTGEVEVVSGTRSGKRKVHLPVGHPLRTHDLKPFGSRKKAHEERKQTKE
jgi:hypothetical protein